MGKSIRVLLVEDEENDAELTIRSLKNQGYLPVWKRVEASEELQQAIAADQWDVVLSDFHLPGLNGMAALEIIKDSGKDIPFIMLTGTIGEDNAAAVMKAGADDFILKDRTARLGPAIDRAMADTRLRAERRRAITNLHEINQDLSALVNALPLAIIVLDSTGLVRQWSPSAATMFGWEVAELIGNELLPLMEDPSDPLRALIRKSLHGQSFVDVEAKCRRKIGTDGDFMFSLAPLPGVGQETRGVVLIASDITERKASENRARHALKMESIGQLSAGIAHEIRTPLQFIGDNLRFLQQSCQDLLPLIASSQALGTTMANESQEPGSVQRSAVAVIRAAQVADAEYLAREMPKAIEQSLEGVERVSTIVKALKEFSHPDSGNMAPVDLQRAIESTLSVARNEYKYVADVVTHFDPGLPEVECVQGEINQVVLNLVVNASHAIGDAIGKSEVKGTITVSTRRDQEMAEIRIADTGTGIPEHARAHIFSPFFTTKEVGKGTGQGLALAHAIIVKRHHGTITFDTVMGKGTIFIIRIPLTHKGAQSPGNPPS